VAATWSGALFGFLAADHLEQVNPENPADVPAASPAGKLRASIRRRCCAVALAVAIGASTPAVDAINLGPVTQQSALGEPLRIVIPVVSSTDEDPFGECYRFAPEAPETDGIPQISYGQVGLEQTSSGTRLVVTSPRPANDPVVRLTLQVGCDNPTRREYTLFMDPPRVEAAAVAAAESEAARPTPVPAPPPTAARRPRSAATGAAAKPRAPRGESVASEGTGSAARASRKPASRPSSSAKTGQQRAVASSAPQQRLRIASAPPASAIGVDAAHAQSQQELASALEAETVVLQRRIAELTAMIDRMQQDIAARLEADRASAEAAKGTIGGASATPSAPTSPPQSSPPAETVASATSPSTATQPAPPPPPAEPAPPAVTSATPAPATPPPPEPAQAAPPATPPPTAKSTSGAATPTTSPKTPPARVVAPSLPSATSWWETGWFILFGALALVMITAGVIFFIRQRAAASREAYQLIDGAVRATTDLEDARALRNAPAGLGQVTAASRAASLRQNVSAAHQEPITISPQAAPKPITPLAVSLLSQVTEEARVYIALGHPERAMDVLRQHIKELPRAIPPAWLMLLELYHNNLRRQEFRELAEEFHKQFNVQTPQWEGFSSTGSGEGGLDTFPHIIEKVVASWRQPQCRAYLEHLLRDNRQGSRSGFPLAAYSDILMLLQILDPASETAKGRASEAQVVAAPKKEQHAAPATTLPATPPAATAPATPAGAAHSPTAKPRVLRPMPPEHPPRPTAVEDGCTNDPPKPSKPS
jgi:hypothetical protein